jgi:hypothetical protein
MHMQAMGPSARLRHQLWHHLWHKPGPVREKSAKTQFLRFGIHDTVVGVFLEQTSFNELDVHKTCITSMGQEGKINRTLESHKTRFVFFNCGFRSLRRTRTAGIRKIFRRTRNSQRISRKDEDFEPLFYEAAQFAIGVGNLINALTSLTTSSVGFRYKHRASLTVAP